MVGPTLSTGCQATSPRFRTAIFVCLRRRRQRLHYQHLIRSSAPSRHSLTWPPWPWQLHSIPRPVSLRYHSGWDSVGTAVPELRLSTSMRRRSPSPLPSALMLGAVAVAAPKSPWKWPLAHIHHQYCSLGPWWRTHHPNSPSTATTFAYPCSGTWMFARTSVDGCYCCCCRRRLHPQRPLRRHRCSLPGAHSCTAEITPSTLSG